MARPDKSAAVAELADQFRTSQGAVLTEYRGLTVKQLGELRRVLGDNASYAVVKNTLTKIAAAQAGVTAFDDLLVGPSAIAFIRGDAVETAKGLRDFARANAPLVIKGGILDGKPLTVDEISKIADLESREVLLGRLAGALLASLQQAAYLFNAPLSQVARLAAALRDKVEADAPTEVPASSETDASTEAPASSETDPAPEPDAAGDPGADASADTGPAADADPEPSPAADGETPTAEPPLS